MTEMANIITKEDIKELSDNLHRLDRVNAIHEYFNEYKDVFYISRHGQGIVTDCANMDEINRLLGEDVFNDCLTIFQGTINNKLMEKRDALISEASRYQLIKK